jgi:uncharacterized protein with GYD domain
VLLGHLIPAGTGFRRYQDIVAIEESDDDATAMLAEAKAAAEARGASRNDPMGAAPVDVHTGNLRDIISGTSAAQKA